MKKILWGVLLCWVCSAVTAGEVIEPTGTVSGGIALTVDMCSGHTDDHLLNILIDKKVKTTFFVTAKWIKNNPSAVEKIKQHPELFRVENHGAHHWAALIDEKSPYGVRRVETIEGLRQEVEGGSSAIKESFPGMSSLTYYRSATAQYDKESLSWLSRNHYKIGVYSIATDGGGKFPPQVTLSKLRAAKNGDIIIIHGNHPEFKNGEVVEKYLGSKDTNVFVWLEK